jgi:two-component system, OmpR family, sensor histidine kinase KdpD
MLRVLRYLYNHMIALPRWLRPIGHSAFASLAVALTTAGLIALHGFFPPAVIALLYLLMVVISTTIWGGTAGVVTSFLSFLAFNYFFLIPLHSFTVRETQDLVALLVFLIVAVVVSNLMGRSQTRLAQILARENEVTHLYELSVALIGLKDEQGIVEVLAQHTLDILPAARVEVIIQPSPPNPPVRTALSASEPAENAIEETLPLATSRGSLGTIHLWTKKGPLTAAEKRLLQIITSQAGLAIERNLLSETENRAAILEESDRLKTAILSSVSHDLRTPLASIQAAATSLSSSEIILEPEARADLLLLLVEETEHLNQLVGNLLNMSRIEAGALKLKKEWNSITDIVDTAVARLRRSSAGHTILVDVADELPLLEVDAVLIEQVMINLIDNSLKYALPESAIHIDAHPRQDTWMQISLSNQGPTLPEESLERLFDKFYTFSGVERTGSTGLGLSICKGIVEAHGGRIWAENITGGMAFHFLLPLSKGGDLRLPASEAVETL